MSPWEAVRHTHYDAWIAWRSIQQRAFPSALTGLSIGLGVSLVVAVLVVHSVIDQSFRRGSQGYDVIVGAKGGQLQLVLNTVFHLSQPTENIPYSYYKEFVEGKFVPAVETAVPVCMGHDYKGCRVVATEPSFFEELTYHEGKEYKFAEGRNFAWDEPFEAVAGAVAARSAGLEVDGTFRPVDSVARGDEQFSRHDHPPFTVVGILAPTGTPNDQALFINIEGFYRFPCHTGGPSFSEKLLAGSGDAADSSPDESEQAGEPAGADHARDEVDDPEHAEHEHEGIPVEDRELTAILVATVLDQHPELAMGLPRIVNEEPVAQAVMPARVIAELFDGIIGNVQLILLVLAVLVVVVAGIGILVSIYNSMNDRRHEIAVMRALGASRWTVMSVILLESILLSLGGGAVGLLLGHGLIGVLGPMIAEETGVFVSALQFQLVELILIPGLIVLATLVGYLPAVSAYQTDVAKALTDTP